MQKKNKTWLIILIIAIVLLLIGAAFWLKFSNRQSSSSNSLMPFINNQPQLPGRTDQGAGSIAKVNDQPYVTLNYTASDSSGLELTLNTIPVSVGGAAYEVSFADQNLAGNYDLMNFPFQALLNFPTAKNNTGSIVTKLDAIEPYQSHQIFEFYPQYQQKTLTSADGYFSLKNEQLDQVQNLVFLTTAGLPGELPNAKSVISLTKEINGQTYNFPLAYQLSFSSEQPTTPVEIKFTTDFPLEEGTQPQILAYDQRTMNWFPLETQNSNPEFTATSDQIFSLYLLAI